MESSSTSTRKPCFLEDDTGLASLTENHHSTSTTQHLIISRSLCSPTSTKTHSPFSQLSSRKFFNIGKLEKQKQPSYFLDACFLCKKPLACNKDIFMYRGDTAFCSEECRTEQIDKDEAKENWNNISVSMKKKSLARKKEVQSEKSSNTTSSNKASNNNYPFQSGALAAA